MKMNTKKYNFLLFLIIGILLTSCGINSNLMLKTPRDYQYETMDVDSANKNKKEYVIEINDIINFRFFTNNGLKVLDIVSGGIEGGGNQAMILNSSSSISYVIRADSMVRLPLIGDINLVGKTIIQAEYYLQDKYEEYYVDPYIQINITNKRVIVFPGNGGDAQVVLLNNNNTTLMEVIALSGGITERGRAKHIKLIRNVDGERKVYLIDLSTIDGLKYTDLIVQNGDYIYVEPVPELGKELFKEIAPVVSIISSAAIIFTVINSFQ